MSAVMRIYRKNTPFLSIALPLHSKSSFPLFKKQYISIHYTEEGNIFQIFMQRRNGRGFALRGGRSTRSQTGLAPGASAAHRRRMADKEKPKRKRAVARQASNPLEAAEKRGVPGGLQRGPRRGGAPNRPPLPPREAAPCAVGKTPDGAAGNHPYVLHNNLKP